ncbi:MAG: ABC transporter ATP-binding protein [Flavobacteriales bacterium]|nr:ABC transporter ATP-binding protein [Flavobacteriales bacterium]
MIFISSIEFQNRIDELKKLLSVGNTNRALKRLIDVTKELSYREGELNAISLSSRFQLLEGEYKIKGVVGFETYSKEINKINDGIILFLTELENFYALEEKIKDKEGRNYETDNDNSVLVGLNITKRFENFELTNINLEIKERTITGLVGENGSGKTTLMKIISGALESDDGELNYFGNETNNWFKIKQDIAYISQVPPTWIMPLRDVLSYYCKIKSSLQSDEVAFEVERIINRLGLKFFESHDWNSLSGGFKTRFEIARALISKPKIMILDEPLAHLDPNAQSIFLQDIRDIISESNPPMAVIISSQHIQEIETIADEVLVLQNGRTRFYGKKENISKDYEFHELEILCDLDSKLLTSLLKGFHSEIDLIQKGMFNILSIPLSVKVNDVLSFLISKEVKIKFVKDISESSKRIL